MAEPACELRLEPYEATDGRPVPTTLLKTLNAESVRAKAASDAAAVETERARVRAPRDQQGMPDRHTVHTGSDPNREYDPDRRRQRPRFLDRMPVLARERPMPPEFSTAINVGTDQTQAANAWDWAHPEDTIEVHKETGEFVPSAGFIELSKDDMKPLYELGRLGNVTSFTPNELKHPINFFEQSVRCRHCGTDRFVPSSDGLCCAKGRLVLGGKPFPKPLSKLMDEGAGISSTSRQLNNLYRFAQQATAPPSPYGNSLIPLTLTLSLIQTPALMLPLLYSFPIWQSINPKPGPNATLTRPCPSPSIEM